MTCRLGSACSGMAQKPGAITYPSDRAAPGGRPRTRMKLCGGTEANGPTRIAKGTLVAGSAVIVPAMLIESGSDVCARAAMAIHATAMTPTIVAGRRCRTTHLRQIRPGDMSDMTSLTAYKLPLDADFRQVLCTRFGPALSVAILL